MWDIKHRKLFANSLLDNSLLYKILYTLIITDITFTNTHILKLLTNLLGRYARIVDHLAVRDVAQGAPLGGGSTLHPSRK